MKKVDLYTDGACSGNPGKGGFAGILMYNGREKEYSGFEAETTNNRMEMRAVIEGLKMLKEGVELHIYSDSASVGRVSLPWGASKLRPLAEPAMIRKSIPPLS